MHFPSVIELILMDQDHPRSLAYQLNALQQHIAGLPRAHQRQRLADDERCLLESSTRLRLADAVKLSSLEEEDGVHRALDDLLDQQATSLWTFSDVITRTYFSHSQPIKQLSPQQPDEDV